MCAFSSLVSQGATVVPEGTASLGGPNVSREVEGLVESRGGPTELQWCPAESRGCSGSWGGSAASDDDVTVIVDNFSPDIPVFGFVNKVMNTFAHSVISLYSRFSIPYHLQAAQAD